MSGFLTSKPMMSETTDQTIALEEGKGVEQENLKYSPLVAYIEGRFTKAEDARFQDESRWLEAYRNYRGIYGPDNQFTATEKSRAFVKITTAKVNAAYAQITETLFASNRFPIGVEATPVPEGIEESVYFDPKEQQAQAAPQGQMQTSARIARPDIMLNLGPLQEMLDPVKDKIKPGSSGSQSAANFEPAKAAAELLDKKIRDVLAEANGEKALRSFVFEQVLFGTGVFKGPLLKDKEYPKWDKTGVYTPVIKPIPDLSQVSLWDAYPDPEARTSDQGEMEYFVQRHRFSKSQLRALKKRPHFRKESIDFAIDGGPNYQERYWESVLKDDKSEQGNERFEVLEYWGLVDADVEDLTGIEIPKQYKGMDEVQINAWICNGQLLRLVYNPFTPVRIPYFLCPYEINPYSIFGVGVAENMSDTQLLMNGFMRMAVDNGVLSSNIAFEINENFLSPGQDFEMYPGKVFKTNGVPGQSIFSHKFPNVTQECMLLFDKARQLADEATGIPSYSHGVSGIMSTGRTAAGMSMLMGAADKSIKSVVRNIDDYLLSPLGKAIYAFLMQFDFNEKFIGDLDIVALGTLSLMRNEVRSQKILQYLQVSANPVDAPYTNRSYLWGELAKTMDIDAEKAVYDSRQALIQAELMKQLAIAQGIPPEQMAQGAGMNTGGVPPPTDPTGNGGGNIAPGQAQPPGDAGFTGSGGGQNSAPKPPQG